MLLKEPELIPTVRLPGEHCSVPLFGHVLELLRERFAHGQPVTLGENPQRFILPWSNRSTLLSTHSTPA